MKKTFFIFLIILLIGTLCLASCQEPPLTNDEYSKGLEYMLNDRGDSYWVVGVGNNRDRHLIIPSEYNGLPVIKIGNDAFYECSWITSITIPSSVLYIGDKAFACCESLQNINFSNGLTHIGDSAFTQCVSIHSITIPDTVTSIGKGAFENCDSLKDVRLSNSLKTIKEYTFSYCRSLKNVEITRSVKTIEKQAFIGCQAMEKIVIPSSVNYIRDDVFNCSPEYSTSYLTIYCEAKEAPAGWSENWNRIQSIKMDSEETKYIPVVWGYEAK